MLYVDCAGGMESCFKQIVVRSAVERYIQLKWNGWFGAIKVLYVRVYLIGAGQWRGVQWYSKASSGYPFKRLSKKTMLYINARNLSGPLTGVQRYTREIINAASREDIEFSLLSPRGDLNGYLGHMWEQLVLPFRVPKNEVLWSPANTGPMFMSNHIMTIHDVIPLDHPEWFSAPFNYGFRSVVSRAAKNCRKIITVSNYSKERICYHFGVPENKIEVVYNGVDITPASLEPYSVPFDRYILAVGSLEPRKNIERLLSAWSSISALPELNGVGLIIVGGSGNSRIFKGSVNTYKGRSSVLFTGRVSDGQLSYLYENALSFAYVSLCEGFGLPPLEAMAKGVPVVTSDNSALAELCSGYARLVDAGDVESIADGLLDVVQAEGEFQSKAKAAKKMAESFTWKACAEKTLGILAEG